MMKGCEPIENQSGLKDEEGADREGNEGLLTKKVVAHFKGLCLALVQRG